MWKEFDIQSSGPSLEIESWKSQSWFLCLPPLILWIKTICSVQWVLVKCNLKKKEVCICIYFLHSEFCHLSWGSLITTTMKCGNTFIYIQIEVERFSAKVLLHCKVAALQRFYAKKRLSGHICFGLKIFS